MKIVVIGATGHIGGYLVPRLVAAGHEVVAISRGLRAPYRPHPAWNSVERITADRSAEDAAGTFAARIADLNADAVVDLVCFTRSAAEQLVEALRGRVELLVSCGTIWVHGTATEVPTTEDAARRPWGEYGVGKAEIEELLLHESRRAGGLRSVVLHPGHISGPGWKVINPAGNLDLDVWEKLATGREVVLPNFGLETVHHVHADDVAQAFQLAIERQSEAVGNSFHVVSDRALTLRGFAEGVAGWFGREAALRFVPFDEFRDQTSAESAAATLDHISRSPSASIDKARRLLGYSPRYTSLEAVAEAVEWLRQDGQLTLA
ncbi:NAD-dependent epimerase/dehydratase family protein [Glaciihabitans sp. UYNi722]|uniref:NAD-dependent epimerase/dehydratase family protein n=1 Tax=Glaciihabitans sp. UYNi722 TaxID=3156344 RepID=UPI00339488BE